MKRKWKIILGAVVASAIIGAIVFEALKPLQTDLLKIEKRAIADTFKEEGTVTAEVHRPVYPSHSGKVTEVPVEEGDAVKEGQVLVVLDTQDLSFQLGQLQGQLKSIKGEEQKSFREPYSSQLKQQELLVEQAERDLQTAQTNFERIKQLFDSGAVSKQEYEEAENTLKTAESNLEQQQADLNLLYESHKPSSGTSQYFAGMKESLQAQIESVKHQIDQSAITSPVDGIVSDLQVKEGTMVSSAAPVTTVFQKGSFRVEVFVLTEDVPKLEEGMPVDLIQDISGTDHRFEGRIERIAPSAVIKLSSLGLEEQRVKVTVTPQPSEEIDLRPGYAVDVEFTTGRQDGKLVVPKTALFPYEEGDALWVIRGGKAEIQPVTTGFENDREVAVEKGLRVGDSVVLNPQLDGLKEGKRVKDL